MNARGWLVGIGSLLLVVATCSVPAGASRIVPQSPNSEIARIQQHLLGAEALLARAKTGGMSAAQLRARRVHRERLASYRASGRFPHNHDVPGRRVPVFVDEHGTQCAMAYLIAQSGRADIVKLVARTKNNATVVELAADRTIGPILLAWLEGAGFSVGEAQRVQPSYPFDAKGTPDDRVTGPFASASASLGLVSVVSVGMNVGDAIGHRRSRWPVVLGFLAGGANVGLGAANARYEGERRGLGIANVAIGSVSIAASAWSFLASKPAPSLAFRFPGSEVVLRPSADIDRRLGPTLSLGGSF